MADRTERDIFKWLAYALGIAVLCFLIITTVQILTYRRTEAQGQRNMLARVSSIKLSEIESVSIYWRWGHPPREAVLTSKTDYQDISAIYNAITTDLWVSNREEGTNFGYDLIRIHLKHGGQTPINCWIGDAQNGRYHLSLTLRSRSGEFKQILQNILYKKGRSLGQQDVLPSDIQPAAWLRDMAQGKKPDDISKILITSPWSNDTMIVSKRSDISAFLKGMRLATEPKVKCACGGPRITIVWKASNKNESFGFCTIHGPKHAYGMEFAKAYNWVAPSDRRIDLSEP